MSPAKSRKSHFRSWFDQSYLQFVEELKVNGTNHLPIYALLSRIEFACLSLYDQRKSPSFIERIKWSLIHLCISKEISFRLSGLNNNDNVQVLFVPKQLKHLEVQLPVFKDLKANSVSVAFLTTDSRVAKELKKEALPRVIVSEKKRWVFAFGRYTYIRKILTRARKIKDFNFDKTSVKFHDAVFFASRYYQSYETTTRVFHMAVARFSPKMIVLGYELSLQSRTIIPLAKEDGILTAALQIGRLRYSMLKFTEVDYYYLYGEKSAEYMLKSITSESVPIPAGSFKIESFDYTKLPNEVNEVATGIRNNYAHLILLAFSGSGIEISRRGHIANLQILTEIIPAFKNHFFLFKLHGKDDISYYYDIMKYDNVLVIDCNHSLFTFDILNWIYLSDIVISGVSTASQQALGLRKPIISLDIDSELEGNLFLQEEVVLHSSTKEELITHIEALSEGSFYDMKVRQAGKFIDQYYKKGSTSSAKFIAQHLNGLLESGSPTISESY